MTHAHADDFIIRFLGDRLYSQTGVSHQHQVSEIGVLLIFFNLFQGYRTVKLQISLNVHHPPYWVRLGTPLIVKPRIGHPGRMVRIGFAHHLRRSHHRRYVDATMLEQYLVADPHFIPNKVASLMDTNSVPHISLVFLIQQVVEGIYRDFSLEQPIPLVSP